MQGSHHADTQTGRVAWRTDFPAKTSIAQSCWSSVNKQVSTATDSQLPELVARCDPLYETWHYPWPLLVPVSAEELGRFPTKSQRQSDSWAFEGKGSHQFLVTKGCNHIHSKKAVVLASMHKTVVLSHSGHNRSLPDCPCPLHPHKQSFHPPG